MDVQTSAIRPTHVLVDLGAIRRNLQLVREAAVGRAVCGMVKANAYGHGLVPVGRALAEANVDFLAVALVEEGMRLRQAGLNLPILVVGGALDDGFVQLVAHNLTPVLFRKEHLRVLAEAAGGNSVAFHLKIDTGMARLGISADAVPDFLEALTRHPQLRLEGVLTHFANADLADHEFNARQLALLEQAHDALKKGGQQPRWVHIANSAAVLSFPEAHQALVRPGLMLYGLDPMHARTSTALAPAMRWVTSPVQVKTVPKGARVSYGGRWVATRESRIATLPIGYADGYRRALGNKAQVLIRGLRAPIIGTVCMDLCMIDVTDIAGAAVGDEVVLMGRQGTDEISAYDLARWGDTIPYEIICGVGARVPRQYIGGAR